VPKKSEVRALFLVGFGRGPFRTSSCSIYVSRLEITDILRHTIDQYKERDSVGVDFVAKKDSKSVFW
jgi:hypothetical protein